MFTGDDDTCLPKYQFRCRLCISTLFNAIGCILRPIEFIDALRCFFPIIGADRLFNNRWHGKYIGLQTVLDYLYCTI